MRLSLFTAAVLGLAVAAVSLASAAADDASFPVATRATRGSSISLPLLTAGGGYYAQVSVGTPAQESLLIVDTGSYDLCLVNASCTKDCDAASAKFNTAASSTYVANPKAKPVNLAFGSGSVTGMIGSDVVSLGDHRIASQSFVVVTNADGLLTAVAPGSGILGLALINEASMTDGRASAGVPFWVALARSKSIAAPLFTLQLTRQKFGLSVQESRKNAKLLPGGVLTLGVVDEKQFTGPITYVATTQTNVWAVKLDAIKINGKAIDLPGNAVETGLDSGSTFITAPAAVVDAIYAEVPGAAKVQEGFYSVPCDAVAHLSLSFGGKEWAVNPADLILGTLAKDKSGKEQCLGAVIAPPAGSPSWVVGVPFLRNVFSVWEAGVGKQQPRVGFAPLKGTSH